jgi:hypothetical protein
LNKSREKLAVQQSGTDFYSIHKVDNHVHLAAGMNSIVVREFIKKKLAESPNV